MRLAAIIALAVVAGPLAGSILGAAGVAGVTTAGLAASASFGAVLAYGALQAGIVLIGSLLINAILPPPKPDIPDIPELDPDYPYLEGSSNRARPFATLPRVFGKHRMTPDLAATTYTDLIDEDEQYLYVLLCWGYGPVKLSNIQIGGVPITSYDSDEITHTAFGSTYVEGDTSRVPPSSFPINYTYPSNVPPNTDVGFDSDIHQVQINTTVTNGNPCLLYTSPSPRD